MKINLTVKKEVLDRIPSKSAVIKMVFGVAAAVALWFPVRDIYEVATFASTLRGPEPSYSGSDRFGNMLGDVHKSENTFELSRQDIQDVIDKFNGRQVELFIGDNGHYRPIVKGVMVDRQPAFALDENGNCTGASAPPGTNIPRRAICRAAGL